MTRSDAALRMRKQGTGRRTAAPKADFDPQSRSKGKPPMSFQITGLDAAPFRRLYGLSDDELQSLGVKRLIADASPGFPDRIELRDVEQGEALLLLNYLHQPATRPTEQATPFSSANGPRPRIAPWTRFLKRCESARSRCAPSTHRETWSTLISSVELASSQRAN